MKTCNQCQSSFEVTEEDRRFYEKISPVIGGQTFLIPEPTLCSDCRLQRRLAFRNDHHLYERRCDQSGKRLISMYPQEAPVTVYDKDIWWSDEWDPKDYGREFDFNRSFFEQYGELISEVPHAHTVILDAENSLYTNYNGFVRNCYLCFAGNHLQDSLYCYNAQNSKDCVDCLFVYDSELAYESVHSDQLYNTVYALHSKNCSDSMFIEGCTGVKNCFMSFNLNNKEYCILNEQYSKEEYEKRIESYQLNTYFGFKRALDYWLEVRKNYPKRSNYNLMSEDVSGEYILQSKNCHEAYIVAKGSQDSKYLFSTFPGLKDSYDCSFSGEDISFFYECMGSGAKGTENLFGALILDGCSNVLYSQFMFNSKNCFGCSNMRNAQYCILNKQYTKEEYEVLVPKIIEHMERMGEWGEFFPISMSPYAYNKTVAFEQFPLKKSQLEQSGWNWEDQHISNKAHESYDIPDDINDVSSDITSAVLTCEGCGKSYRIIQQEYAYYLKRQLPIPRYCFDCRHQARLTLRNTRKLYDRQCDKCGVEIQTSYAPDRPETVYCESCYLKEVY